MKEELSLLGKGFVYSMTFKDYPEFVTITCLNWNSLLKPNWAKEIIIDSFRYLVSDKRVAIYGFVLMSTHLHLIWQVAEDYQASDIQRDMLKYTAQKIVRELRNADSDLLPSLLVAAIDRKFQVWERNSLRIPLWSKSVFTQKLDYIHLNPVKARICQYPEEYKYSSAGFYILNQSPWTFLTHADK